MSDSWSGSLPIWVVYKNPSDFPPGTFVARKWLAPGGPTLRYIRSTDLSAVQDQMQQMGLTRLERNEQDDPCILECWI